MDILNISMAQSGAAYTGSIPALQKPAFQLPAATPAEAPKVPETAEDARFQEVQKAAQVVQNNYYVVSDVRFTIFKDIAGDYVTRFTSLKDGHVTYYPQKTLLEEMKIKQAQSASIFQTQA